MNGWTDEPIHESIARSVAPSINLQINQPIHTHPAKTKVTKSRCVTHALQQTPKDTLFCATYENPYERYYNNQKIIGISTRRFRKKVLIQCIIHLENGHKHFSDSLLANKYSSKGLLNYNSRNIQKHLKTQLNHLCKKTPFQWTS